MKNLKINPEKSEAIERLKKLVKPGKKVYTVLEHVSQSGMMRHISVIIVHKGDIFNITWLVGQALKLRRAGNGGLKVGGCGMDMGFHVVYSLGRVLYPKGFRLAKGQYGRNGDTSKIDKDGGYALNQNWV